MVCVWSLRGKHGQPDQTQIDILILTRLPFSPPRGFVCRHNCSLEISVQKWDAMLLSVGTGTQLRPSRPLNGQTLRSLTF